MADVESGAPLSNGRKRLARNSLAGAVLIALALSGAGCSMIDQFNPFGGDKYKMEVTPDVPASKTYDQGSEKLANGSPCEAAKKFTDLGKQYPTSDWARKGLLMTTYANYQAGDYTTAETSAERYLKDYPNSPEADYVLYLQANSYYMQIPDISRDQEKTAKALETFQSVVTKYPKSEYADDAKYKITVTQDQLAGKEMSIGRFYLNRRQLHRRHQSLSERASVLPDDPPCGRGALPSGRGLSWAWDHRGSPDRSRRARAQFPR